MRLVKSPIVVGIDIRNAPCTPLDANAWWDDVAHDRRTGMPTLGQYYVALLVERGELPCLLFERPATRTEAQDLFATFLRDYRTSPRRENEHHFDDLDGIWIGERRRFPKGRLVIVHPDYPEFARGVVPGRDILAAMGFKGKVEAIEDPNTYFSRDWSITRKSSRKIVSVPQYGELLNRALSQSSPLEDLDVSALDSLHASSQALADHTANAPELNSLDSASLEYLQRRLTQVRLDNLHSAAFHNPSDKEVRYRLRTGMDSSNHEATIALSTLQQSLRGLYANEPELYGSLRLDSQTLSWLDLEDLADQFLDRKD